MNCAENQESVNCVYLAPLQGFTDFVYRRAFGEVFNTVDKYFIPYISVKNETVLKKYGKEVLQENNPQQKVVPQILASSAGEMEFLTQLLEDEGYKEINLNAGCPYPMVTNREKGAGLLPLPEKLDEILSAFYNKSKLKLSVKMRAGLLSEKEIEQVIPVLNRYPLTEVILHPRIAKQLYSGEILESAFQFAKTNLSHRLVYNGDIFSVETYKTRQAGNPEICRWMLGRGVLMNTFLPSEIKGIYFSNAERERKLTEFHQRIFDLYLEFVDNEGNVLNKMKQFWQYFCFNFQEPQKCFKRIKKAGSLQFYKTETIRIFRDFS